MALAHKCGWSGRPIVVCSCAPCTKTVMHRHRTELYHVCAWNALFVGVGFGSWCFIFAHVSSSAWSMQPKIEIRWYNNAPSQGGCVSPTTKFHWVTWLAASGLGPFLWNLIWFRHWCHVLFPCGAKSQKRIANIIFYLYLFIFSILCGIVCQARCVDVKFMLSMDVVDWQERTEDSGSHALSVKNDVFAWSSCSPTSSKCGMESEWHVPLSEP